MQSVGLCYSCCSPHFRSLEITYEKGQIGQSHPPIRSCAANLPSHCDFRVRSTSQFRASLKSHISLTHALSFVPSNLTATSSRIRIITSPLEHGASQSRRSRPGSWRHLCFRIFVTTLQHKAIARCCSSRCRKLPTNQERARANEMELPRRLQRPLLVRCQ